MKTGLSLFLLLFWVAFSANGQQAFFPTAKPEALGLSSDSLARITATFKTLVDEQRLAGIQSAILRKGKLVHFESYGYANLEEQRLLDSQSIFRLFSMTKPIVSAALLQLYDQGKFQLDDPLHKFLPEFKQMYIFTDSTLVPAKNPIRVIDILRHTSGFSYGRSHNAALDQCYTEANLNASPDNKSFMQKLSKIPLQFEPGTDWQYGLSTNICGYLVEVLSGMPLDQYLQKNIFDPLGMKDTHFQLPADKAEHFTVGYVWQNDQLNIFEQQRDNRYLNPVTLFNGGGGLVSTTLDYLKFCQMILQKGKAPQSRILKATTVDLMLKDQLVTVRKHQERLRLPANEASFGLGFAIRGTDAQQLESIFGWGGAVGTYFKIDPQNEMVYLYMIQLSPYRHLQLREQFHQFVQAALLD